MTPGIDNLTMDGMGMERINQIVDQMRDHSYQPNPVRKHYILKKNGKKRPLGIPSTDDKLVQEVVRMILESIYEPVFCSQSHGFRPKRSCHSALLPIQKNYTGVKWFVEGDIKGCFDNIDQHILIGILRRKIQDEQLIALIWKFLGAGYMEDWKWNRTYSGTAQGSVISPILANIYMNGLDKFMAEYKEQFDTGKKRANRNIQSGNPDGKAINRQRRETGIATRKKKEKSGQMKSKGALTHGHPCRPWSRWIKATNGFSIADMRMIF